MNYTINGEKLGFFNPKLYTISRRNLNNNFSYILSLYHNKEPFFSGITNFENEFIKKSLNEKQFNLIEKSPIDENIKSFLSSKISLKKIKLNLNNEPNKIIIRKINPLNSLNKKMRINKYRKSSFSSLNDSNSEMRIETNSQLRNKINKTFKNSLKSNCTIIKIKSENFISYKNINKFNEEEKNKKEILDNLFDKNKTFNLNKNKNIRNQKRFYIKDYYNNNSHNSLYSKISFPIIKSENKRIQYNDIEAENNKEKMIKYYFVRGKYNNI